MKFALYQLFVFACIIIVDVGSALYGRYSGDAASRQVSGEKWNNILVKYLYLLWKFVGYCNNTQAHVCLVHSKIVNILDLNNILLYYSGLFSPKALYPQMDGRVV